jgi:hypothetical protein
MRNWIVPKEDRDRGRFAADRAALLRLFEESEGRSSGRWREPFGLGSARNRPQRRTIRSASA